MRKTSIVIALLGGATFAAQQQAQPNPRQQPGAMVHIFAPEQHDLYDGHFVISANRIYMVGRLNDAEGWDHFDNEGKNLTPVSGTTEIDVNEIQNTGQFEARLKIPEGDLTGPPNRRTEHTLSPASWNRYYEHGRRIFNWAIAQGFAMHNPFSKLTKRPERNKRDTRILPEQERALFDALPKLPLEHQRAEMRRRLIAAVDLGLREGEMLKVQVKHVDFATWTITLPAAVAKGGATTDRPEFVYAMTPRIREVLAARRDLGAEAYVFGAESGTFVASFDKSWRNLFSHAGLPVGRKDGLTWHDLRHEFVSFLVDSGGEIHEVKEAARHKDIRTTERYMKAREQRLRALMGKMSERGIA